MNVVESLGFFIPEMILSGTFFIVLAADLFVSNKRLLAYMSLAGLAAAFVFAKGVAPAELFFGFFTLDSFACFFRFAVYLAVGLTILASLAYEEIPSEARGEFYLFLTALAILLTLMGAAANLLMIFLAIESVSLLSYLLVGFQKFDDRASEAALKYVLFGAVSTALMLFGMSLVFGLTGAIGLAEVGARIQADASHGSVPLAGIGMVLILAGVGFKISSVPFHMWAPDVYQGAPTPVAAFLTVAPKALGFAVLARILFVAFGPLASHWTALMSVLAIATMTTGNVLAISQFDIKRLLAYSSIGQAGYILSGIAAGSPLGLEAVLIYVIAYLFTNLGAFFCVLQVERQLGSNDISDYAGLSRRNPLLAFVLTLFLLSLAGIPPLAGFIGKVYIFLAVVKANRIGIAVAIALNSAVAAYYYFKIVRSMYLVSNSEEGAPTEPPRFALPVSAKLALALCFFGVLAIGLAPSSLIRFAQASLASFPFF